MAFFCHQPTATTQLQHIQVPADTTQLQHIQVRADTTQLQHIQGGADVVTIAVAVVVPLFLIAVIFLVICLVKRREGNRLGKL